MMRTNVIQYVQKRVNLIFVMCLMIGATLNAQTGLGLNTVVIDPGHGGKDPGAISKNKTQEKDVVLNVGLLLGKKIKAAYPNVKVIYTRSKDEFIGLAERAKIANTAGADLFISLHCNAAANTSAKGAESWVLGLHKSAASLEVAKKENNAILMEDNHEQTYQDFDPNDPDAYIALAMRQNAFLEQSLVFADNVQKNIIGDLKRKDRGVKQAGFVVLYRATMPSVLVELGFLSNKDEEVFLTSKAGQEKLSKELLDAFKAYKEYKEKVDGYSTNPEQYETDVDNKVDVEIVINTSPVQEKGVFIEVQIATSSLNLPTKPENFKGMTDVKMRSSGKYYKYYVGQYQDIEAAKARQNEVRNLGYETAFLVAFDNGEKISVKEAAEKLKSEN